MNGSSEHLINEQANYRSLEGRQASDLGGSPSRSCCYVKRPSFSHTVMGERTALKFSKGDTGLSSPDRKQNDRVEVHFAASQLDRKNEGTLVTRTKVGQAIGDSRKVLGALKALRFPG